MLTLRPLLGPYADKERKRIRLAIWQHAEITIGRSSDASQCGTLSNPRISRRHALLAGGPNEPATVTALGSNPLRLITSNEAIVLTQNQAHALSAGDEIHLVAEPFQIGKGADKWLDDPCAYWVGVSSTAVVLTPLDGRRPVRLELTSAGGASLTLGRTAVGANNHWGVRDPRVSRNHARLEGGPNRPVKLHASSNSMQLLKADGQSTVVRKGGCAVVDPGDQVHLVIEAVNPAKGDSLPWAGNPCAYHVELEFPPVVLLRPIGGHADGREEIELPLTPGAAMEIGRQPVPNDPSITYGLEDPRLSRVHAKLEIDASPSAQTALITARGANAIEILRAIGGEPVVLARAQHASLLVGDTVRLIQVR